VNRAQLRSLLRQTLTDTEAWPDASLNSWIGAAVQDYSQYCPRILNADLARPEEGYSPVCISLAACAGILDVLRVECPAGRTPPRFLLRCSETAPRFAGYPVYAVPDDPPKELWLGQALRLEDVIRVTYAARHIPPANDLSELSVPAEHEEALRLYVTWQALSALALRRAAEDGFSAEETARLDERAQQAGALYRLCASELARRFHRLAISGPWKVDGLDRIY